MALKILYSDKWSMSRSLRGGLSLAAHPVGGLLAESWLSCSFRNLAASSCSKISRPSARLRIVLLLADYLDPCSLARRRHKQRLRHDLTCQPGFSAK